MKAKKQRKTTKSAIKTKRIVVKLYTNKRFFDSFNEFIAPNVFASGGCGACTGGSCFLADTQILMADGSTKAIQEIEVGDRLKTYSVAAGRIVVGKVKDTIAYRTQPGGYYIINNSLYVTGQHRFWVNNREWKPAEGLKIGDKLINNQSKVIKIESVTYASGHNDVYNLEMSGMNHNYFAQNIVVHNGPNS